MPIVINPQVKPSAVAEINALSGYMNNKTQATFDQIRLDVPLLASHTDSELHQVAIDADLTVSDV